jgi:hypothetical protein
MRVILRYTLYILYFPHPNQATPMLHRLILQCEYSFDIRQLTKRVRCILLDRLSELPYRLQLYRRVDCYTRHHLRQVGGVSLHDSLKRWGYIRKWLVYLSIVNEKGDGEKEDV